MAQNRGRGVVCRFQFQTGSIRSKRGGACLIWYPSFNSKLVRLEVLYNRVAQACVACLNSKLVRLEVQESEFAVFIDRGFNSKLVRLEGCYGDGQQK